MTPEEREAVRELIAALQKCEAFLPGFDGDRCGRPATWTVNDSYADSGDREHYCDAHAEDRKKRTWEELPHAPALRKLQAMLDQEETADATEPPVETRCEVCSRAVNIGDDVLYCSEDDTVQHTGCSGLTNARGTPWMG